MESQGNLRFAQFRLKSAKRLTGTKMGFRDANSAKMLAALGFACASALAFALPSTAQDAPIPSSSSDALPPPEAWRCDRIAPEYDAWLKGGNTPETWRYAGPTYRKDRTDEVYDWNDWLDWHRTHCGVGMADAGHDGSASGTHSGVLIGGVVGALGVTAIVAGAGGGGTDSPG